MRDTVRISMNMDAALVAAVDRLAADESRDRTKQMHQLIREALARREVIANMERLNGTAAT